MRKQELTEEQQEEFKWLMNADTINEDVEINEYGTLIWKDGTWEDGFWGGGIWKGGIWKGGYWEGRSMWSNLKQRYVEVKWDGYEFKEIN